MTAAVVAVDPADLAAGTGHGDQEEVEPAVAVEVHEGRGVVASQGAEGEPLGGGEAEPAEVAVEPGRGRTAAQHQQVEPAVAVHVPPGRGLEEARGRRRQSRDLVEAFAAAVLEEVERGGLEREQVEVAVAVGIHGRHRLPRLAGHGKTALERRVAQHRPPPRRRAQDHAVGRDPPLLRGDHGHVVEIGERGRGLLAPGRAVPAQDGAVLPHRPAVPGNHVQPHEMEGARHGQPAPAPAVETGEEPAAPGHPHLAVRRHVERVESLRAQGRRHGHDPPLPLLEMGYQPLRSREPPFAGPHHAEGQDGESLARLLVEGQSHPPPAPAAAVQQEAVVAADPPFVRGDHGHGLGPDPRRHDLLAPAPAVPAPHAQPRVGGGVRGRVGADPEAARGIAGEHEGAGGLHRRGLPRFPLPLLEAVQHAAGRPGWGASADPRRAPGSQRQTGPPVEEAEVPALERPRHLRPSPRGGGAGKQGGREDGEEDSA